MNTVCPISPTAELLDAALEEEGGTLIARKVGEAVQNTLGAVVGAIDIPLGENQIYLAVSNVLLNMCHGYVIYLFALPVDTPIICFLNCLPLLRIQAW